VDIPAVSPASTTNDAVAESKMAASPRPGNGRTDPDGFSVVAGETAARAGEIVGGGRSAGLDEHPDDAKRQATIVTIAMAL
jgi:hypothetical protein